MRLSSFVSGRVKPFLPTRDEGAFLRLLFPRTYFSKLASCMDNPIPTRPLGKLFLAAQVLTVWQQQQKTWIRGLSVSALMLTRSMLSRRLSGRLVLYSSLQYGTRIVTSSAKNLACLLRLLVRSQNCFIHVRFRLLASLLTPLRSRVQPHHGATQWCVSRL